MAGHGDKPCAHQCSDSWELRGLSGQGRANALTVSKGQRLQDLLLPGLVLIFFHKPITLLTLAPGSVQAFKVINTAQQYFPTPTKALPTLRVHR